MDEIKNTIKNYKLEKYEKEIIKIYNDQTKIGAPTRIEDICFFLTGGKTSIDIIFE